MTTRPDDPFSVHRVPGTPGDAGRAHGEQIAEILSASFVERYCGLLCEVLRVEPADLCAQAARWLDGLPANFQEEIDGMAGGAGRPVADVARFLFADIASPTKGGATTGQQIAGPMCSAAVTGIGGPTWVARNCDWLTATLLRGTAAVVHETPGRIPVLAVGIRGDIDVDTGINAEGLWLHLHTLPARDDPPRDWATISWLFWAREALEVCATLDELERFIETIGRDRGVIAVACEARTGAAAVFECGRSEHTRIEYDPARPLIATNFEQSKRITPDRRERARPGGAIGRFCALRDHLGEHVPEHGPDDLMEALAEPGVEMRRPPNLRTIYSAVVSPTRKELWFASGLADGTPAASRGKWERVRLPW